MPLINNSVYFIHIPRNAGRWITKLFSENGYDLKFNFFDERILIKNKIFAMELPHLSYPEYTILFKEKNTKCFTIIRDPVTRFKSLLKDKKYDLDKIFYNKDNFIDFVNERIMFSSGNWFLPQVNFITKDTFLWRLENDLKKDFFDWLYVNFGFTFEKTDVLYDAKEQLDAREIILNKKQINLIKEYYYKDYKILGY